MTYFPSQFDGYIQTSYCGQCIRIPFYNIAVTGGTGDNGGGDNGSGDNGSGTGYTGNTGTDGNYWTGWNGGGGVIVVDPWWEPTGVYNDFSGNNPVIDPLWKGDDGQVVFSGDDGYLYKDSGKSIKYCDTIFKYGGQVWYYSYNPTKGRSSAISRMAEDIVKVPIKCIAGVPLSEGYAYFCLPYSYPEDQTTYANPFMDLVCYDYYRLQSDDCSFSIGSGYKSKQYYEIVAVTEDTCCNAYLYSSGGTVPTSNCNTGTCWEYGGLCGSGLYADRFLESLIESGCNFLYTSYLECERIHYTIYNCTAYPSCIYYTLSSSGDYDYNCYIYKASSGAKVGQNRDLTTPVTSDWYSRDCGSGAYKAWRIIDSKCCYTYAHDCLYAFYAYSDTTVTYTYPTHDVYSNENECYFYWLDCDLSNPAPDGVITTIYNNNQPPPSPYYIICQLSMSGQQITTSCDTTSCC